MEEKGRLSEGRFDAGSNIEVSEQEKDEISLSGYGLRENPRRTWRSVDSRLCLSQGKHVCRQCGKGFQSLKALCGHMACHSEKHRDDASWISENCFAGGEGDHQRRLGRRPSSKRKKSLENLPFLEIDLQEQQEVAICLMLLSGSKGGVQSVESSGNNSTKSSSVSKQVKSSGNFSDPDSAYFLDESSDEDYRDEVAKNGAKTVKTEEKRCSYECFNCKKMFSSYQALGGHKPCCRRTNDAHQSCENSIEEEDAETSRKKVSAKLEKKNQDHACEFCSRVFKNGQALGGHKRSHFIISYDRSNSTTTPLMKTTLLDLNLPAPESLEDDPSHSHIFPW